VTAPDGISVVASGTRDDASAVVSSLPAPSAGTWRTTRFEATRPVRYLACVLSQWKAIGASTAAIAGTAVPFDRVTVDAIASPPQVRRSAGVAAEAANILAFYASAAGGAPYPTFTAAVIDDDLPGGHSPAYFALIQQPRPASYLSWRSDPVAFDHVPEFVLAHEIAHQWWGQAVGYTTYHDQWLSEGLAQYFALRYVTATKSPGVARAMLRRMRNSVRGLEREGPITLGYRLGHIRGTPRVFRAVLYNKSALVLDMLRRVIGDVAFTAGLRDFYATWRFETATTNDLRATFERASGRSLERFFDRWIRGATLPHLRVSWHQAGAAAAVRIEQLGEVFDVPVPIAIDYADGTTQTIDVVASESVTEAQLPLRGPVRRVRVDRDVTLMR
jgi:hypothetical protein